MDTEQEFAYAMYNDIAKYFSDSPESVVDFVEHFLKSRQPEEKGLEIGCGNGTNLGIREDLDLIGVEISESLIQLCMEKGLRVYQQNCCSLKFKDNSFHYAFAIAVFHHLATTERRLIAIREMIRVLKPGGKGIFSVWSLERTRRINRAYKPFVLEDNNLSWTRKSDGKLFSRYYYIFNKSKLNKLLEYFTDDIIINSIFNKRRNWVVEFTKK